MSMKLMVEVFNVDFGSPIKKLIMLKLADNADDKGMCFPSMAHIAEKCNCSRSSVVRSINALKASGYLSIQQRQKPGSKEKQSNIYTINLGGVTEALGSSRELQGSSTVTLGGSSTELQESITSFNLPINNKAKAKASAVERPDGVSNQVWFDFNKQRKAKLTQTALNGIIKQSQLAGLSLNEALTESVERGWQSFKAEWVRNKNVQKGLMQTYEERINDIDW